ncbi:DUF6409 family protein [Actinomadura sp. 3N508]|uniref:DUF6409 family protein n=1 Tax=Actinomadura sp. 3N508 TaxID=3375153 RepID=UPI00378C196C
MSSFPIGSLVMARRWVRGHQERPRKAIVTGTLAGDVVVWFYTLGDPEIGESVQAFPAGALTALEERLEDRSARALLSLERAASRGRLPEGFQSTVHGALVRRRRIDRAAEG